MTGSIIPEDLAILQVEAPEDVDVPKHLLAPEAVEQLVAERQPRFVPLERYGPGADPTPPADSATGESVRSSVTVLLPLWDVIHNAGGAIGRVLTFLMPSHSHWYLLELEHPLGSWES